MKQQRLTFKKATRNGDQLRINCLAAFNVFKTTAVKYQSGDIKAPGHYRSALLKYLRVSNFT